MNIEVRVENGIPAWVKYLAVSQRELNQLVDLVYVSRCSTKYGPQFIPLTLLI